MKLRIIALVGIGAILAIGQTPTMSQSAKQASAPAKPAVAKPAAPVDSVIQLVKSGMSESLIIRTLKQQNKPFTLNPADLVKLQQAGVSENIINAMMDPANAPDVTATPVLAPSPPPPSVPVAAPAPPAAEEVSASSKVPPIQAQKKRVIIDEFDYSAVMSQVQAVFGSQQNIGKGIRAMLIKRTAEANKLVVVERAKMDTLIQEQDRNASNRVKQGTGARIGQISGADALLAGDVVIFGRDDKKTKVKGGGLFGGIIGGIASSKDEDKAVVAITYRLIDAETSEVIATGEARGESVRKGKGFGAIGGAFGRGVAGVEVDMTSSNFAETIIGEATMDCVNKLAEMLNTQAEGMKKAVRPVEALVADITGNTMVISAGATDGVNAGEVFEILRIVREVKDPVTKEVLDRITENVGEMTVSSVRDRIATGTYVGKPAQVGFAARKKL
jgi:curli biogenesis system outer membrane secretion channel CsgG